MDRLGVEWGRADWLDDHILRQLHGSGKTFHSLDTGFYRREYCHHTYCLAVYAYEVRTDEDARAVADLMVRLLRHPNFNAHVKRLGKVIRVSTDGIQYWEKGRAVEVRIEW
jgi:hypothetical protein